DLADSADGGDKSVGRGDHLVAVADATGAQSELDRVGAGVDADRVLDADQLREAALELLQRLAESEVAGRDEGLQLAPEVFAVAELLVQIGIADAHRSGG